ncbi:MAG: type I polyketide synthase, partial [Planctomycetota bacterium]
MPTRVSYHLDLSGPSCGIQTGCSTSLVAVHHACRSLVDRECDMALAGGVTIGNLSPAGYLYEEGSIASPDGHCRTFDARGRGTVFGNGVGLVVLKRLQDAIDDGDTIRAVILGSAVNNDGADKVGLLAPSVKGQAAVIRDAFRSANVDPATISYVEAHGTATEIGDPIEFAALQRALGKHLNESDRKCAIGSVKSNVGHLDAAAGIAGLIKATLALQHQEIPASLDFEVPNPQLDLDNSPFFVASETIGWTHSASPRRAGVSSFGMGGTNAHVILEEPPKLGADDQTRDVNADAGHYLLPLSARTKTALAEQVALLTTHLEQNESLNLADVSYTLQVGRRGLPHRTTVVCDSRLEAISKLRQYSSAEVPPDANDPSLVFLFSGQGSQYPKMARSWYESNVLFRQAFDRCSAAIETKVDLRSLVFNSASEKVLNQTENAQPALFAIEYALYRLVTACGIKPTGVLGHSLGEYVAATGAGVFEVEEAIRLVRLRGELMQLCQPGAMLAVVADEAMVQSMIHSDLELAAQNGPQFHVVSGTFEAVDALEKRLNAESVTCQRLETSHAFHSRMLEPALQPFREHLQSLSLNAPKIGIVSNRTADWMTAEQATDPEYWVDHLRNTVRFGESLRKFADKDTVFMEIGPGNTLCRFANAELGAAVTALPTLPGRFGGQSAQSPLWHAFQTLWQMGANIHWEPLHPKSRRRVPLPTYPFERQPYLVNESNAEANQSTGQHLASTTNSESTRTTTAPTPSVGEQKAADPRDWFYIPSWQNRPPVKRIQLAPPSRRTEPSARGPETSTVDGHDVDIDSAANSHIIVLGYPAQRPLFEQLAERLGSTVRLTWVEPGSEFLATDSGFLLNPNSVDDYLSLRTSLGIGGQTPDTASETWIHFWSLKPEIDPFDSLVTWGQAIIQSDSAPAIAPRLAVVTRGLFRVFGNESLCRENSPLAGLLAALPHEIPGLKWRLVDCDQSVEQSQDSLVRELIDCIQASNYPESHRSTIALRGGKRWEQSYTSLPLESDEAEQLKPDATYAIVGDFLDGLGMVYARALRERLNARVILVGPSKLPKVELWDSWLATHGARHPISQLIHQIQGLGREGVEFTFTTADQADSSAMQAAMDVSIERLGGPALQGAFYAGVMGGEASCPLEELDRNQRELILDKKQATLDALISTLDGYHPEFLLLQSSLSTISGGHGSENRPESWVTSESGGGPVWGCCWPTARNPSNNVDVTLPDDT